MAWSPLGWKSVAFAEVEKFPSAVLAYHYPHVPNLGDMTKINGADFRGSVDVLVGGTPCQSFSVAGLRKGLKDERGNLALEFVRLADECDPAFVVWENVPGILSDWGNAFGCFLAALAGEDAPLLPPGGKWSDAGYVLGPRRSIAWRILDAQYFGLAQRRRRVFVAACPRGGANPAAILFEWGGLRRDTAPGRDAGADVAGTLKGGSGSHGWQLGSEEAAAGHVQITQALTGRLGCGGPDDNKAQGGFYVTAAFGGECSKERDVATAICAHDRRQWETDTVIAQTLRAEGFDASEDGTGRANLVGTNQGQEVCVMSVSLRGRDGGGTAELSGDVAGALRSSQGGGDKPHFLQQSAVRRLMPTECEALQGFPRNYTRIPGLTSWRDVSPEGEDISALVACGLQARQTKKGTWRVNDPDGPRYKALGNSMAVSVMRWIGQRIDAAARAKLPLPEILEA